MGDSVDMDFAQDGFFANIEAGKSKYKLERKELRTSVKGVKSAAKTYSKIKQKHALKSSARNATKLARAQSDFSIAIAQMETAKAGVGAVLSEIEREYEALSKFYTDEGKRRKAKKNNRIADKYLKRKEEDVEKLVGLVSDYVIPFKEQSKPSTASVREDNFKAPSANTYGTANTGAAYARADAPGMQQTPPPRYQGAAPYEMPPFYYPPYMMDPYMAFPVMYPQPQPQNNGAELNVQKTVEQAVREATAQIFASVDAKIESCIADIRGELGSLKEAAKCEPETVEAVVPADEAPAQEPVQQTAPEEKEETVQENAITLPKIEGEAETVAKLTGLVESLKALMEQIDGIYAEAQKISEKGKAMAEIQKNVNELQRNSVRESQGIQVKQKLVNQDQSKLAEEQEEILQQQKLIAEKQTQVSETQKATADGFVAITEAQGVIDTAMKSTLQAQKAMLQSNAKNTELQRELSGKQLELVASQREVIAAQKQLLKGKGISPRRKNQKEETEGAEATPEAVSEQEEQ